MHCSLRPLAVTLASLCLLAAPAQAQPSLDRWTGLDMGELQTIYVRDTAGTETAGLVPTVSPRSNGGGSSSGNGGGGGNGGGSGNGKGGGKAKGHGNGKAKGHDKGNGGARKGGNGGCCRTQWPCGSEPAQR